MTEIHLIGLSHQTTPLSLYEQVALAEDEISAILGQLKASDIDEVAILATCNRLEIYTVGAGWAAASAFLAGRCGLAPDDVDAVMYRKSGQDAVQHLMRVAAGLDSIILGEQQILGQVQAAIEQASAAGTSGPVLSHLFALAAHAGKRARHETDISRYTTSISHAAVQLAASHVGDLRRARALVIGGGEMATLAAQALYRHNVRSLVCINRTAERASLLAAQFGAEARPWDQLRQTLAEVDLVITATSAPETVLHADAIRTPLVIVDIALPRDTDPAVSSLPDVRYYDMEALKAFVARNVARREAAMIHVEGIVAEEAARFEVWRQGHDAGPVIAALREKASAVAQGEVAEALRRLGDLDAEQQATIEKLAHRIVNKILHDPTTRLKSDTQYAAVVRELFALDEEAHVSDAADKQVADGLAAD